MQAGFQIGHLLRGGRDRKVGQRVNNWRRQRKQDRGRYSGSAVTVNVRRRLGTAQVLKLQTHQRRSLIGIEQDQTSAFSCRVVRGRFLRAIQHRGKALGRRRN